jgi:hypothetical protein
MSFFIKNNTIKKYYPEENEENIVIPNGITKIGYCAFKDCSNIKTVIIPDTVTTISSKAFKGCVRLDRINIPDSVKTMGSEAFMNCIALHEVKLSESLTIIEDRSFCGCENLELIEIPSSVRLIWFSVFSCCDKLKEVIFHDGLEKIEEHAFYGCSIEKISLPNSVKHIGGEAFAWCSKLQYIKLSKNVTSILRGTFSGCKSLKEICEFGEYEFILSDAFNGCNSLLSEENGCKYYKGWLVSCDTQEKELTVKDGTVRIANFAFQSAKQLEKVILPQSIRFIREYDFACSNVKQVIIKHNTEICISPNTGYVWNLPAFCLDESDCQIVGTLSVESDSFEERIIQISDYNYLIDTDYQRYYKNLFKIASLKQGRYSCSVRKKSGHIDTIGIYFNGIIPLRQEMTKAIHGKLKIESGIVGYFFDKETTIKEKAYIDFNQKHHDIMSHKELLNKIHNRILSSDKDAFVTEIGFFAKIGCNNAFGEVWYYFNQENEIIAMEIRLVEPERDQI